MLIINADDWGGWHSATDAALQCVQSGRITSVSAMVFMDDSERAARLASGDSLSIGLHVNFNQPFTAWRGSSAVLAAHDRIRRFLRRSRLAQLMYHPGLRTAFRDVFLVQLDEFRRLYGREPSHVDGHQHMHLCMNMLLDNLIPYGQRVRRSFFFWPGEKSWSNRTYRRWVDRRLRQRYVVADYFFALSQCLTESRMARVLDLARTATVELMAHPEVSVEHRFLLGCEFERALRDVQLGSYAHVAQVN